MTNCPSFLLNEILKTSNRILLVLDAIRIFLSQPTVIMALFFNGGCDLTSDGGSL